MASLVLPLVNKTPDLLQRTSIFPKRRAPVSGGSTRTRFAKPRPNISALVNKTKEVPPQEKEKISVPQEEISRASEASKDTTAASSVETDENLCASGKEEIVSTSCEQAPEVDEVYPSSLEASTIPEKEPLVEPPPCVVESLEITPPRPKSVIDATFEKEISTAALNKTPDYPTLKSILNSPRKRVTTKKAHERRKRFTNGTETPPRSEMTMIDLIYYNPSGTPMKSTKPQATVVDEPLPSDENAAPVEDEENTDGLLNSVPKVIINEKGEIIIDESSLVIRRKETVDTSVAPVIETDNTTYSSFRKKTSKQWTNKETAKFYKALSLVGTDFALMENIFNIDGKVTRTRRELKLKFKREERQNTELVHQAMYETQTYDISFLDDDPDDVPESSEIENESKKKKRGTKSDKKKKESPEQLDCVENLAIDNPTDKEKESPEQLDCVVNLAIDNPTDPVVNKKKRGRKKKEKDNLPENATSSFLDLIPCYTNQPVVYDTERDSTILDDSVYYYFDENGSQQMDTANEVPAIKQAPSEVNSTHEANPDFVYLKNAQTTDALDAVHSTEKEIIRRRSVESDSGSLRHALKSATYPLNYGMNVVPCTEEEVKHTLSMEQSFGKTPVRSQRVRKAKVMSDFITDEIVLSDSDDPEMALEEEDLSYTKIINKSSSDCDRIHDEFQVTRVGNVQATGYTELPGKLPKCNHVWGTAMEQRTPEDLEVVCLSVKGSKNVGNVVELPKSCCKNTSNDNFLTDAAISEVVTSEAVKRRVKRKAAPNVRRGVKRLWFEMSRQQSRCPSFSNFTPVEEGVVPPKYTYSKQNRTLAQKDDVPVSSAALQSQATAPTTVPVSLLKRTQYAAEVPDKHTLPFNEHSSEMTCQAPLQMDTKFPSNRTQCIVPSLKSPPQTQQNEYQRSAPVYGDDQSPVMIFTKSLNNENILHLFVVKNPADNS